MFKNFNQYNAMLQKSETKNVKMIVFLENTSHHFFKKKASIL